MQSYNIGDFLVEFDKTVTADWYENSEGWDCKKSTVDLHRRVRNQRSFFIPIFKKEVNHNDKTENP